MTRPRWNLRRGLRAAALVGTAVVVLGACAGSDSDRDDVINAVEEAGGTADVAECVSDGFFDSFSQDQINDLAGADQPEDFPSEIAEEADQIMTQCQETDGASFEAEGESTEGEETTDSTESTESSESTDTTAAAE